MRERRERGTGEGKFDSDVLPGEAWETEGTGRAEVGLRFARVYGVGEVCVASRPSSVSCWTRRR